MSHEPKLTMYNFLFAVETSSTNAIHLLILGGHDPNVVRAKAEKADRKGYTEYGFSSDLCWLTAKGSEFVKETTHDS